MMYIFCSCYKFVSSSGWGEQWHTQPLHRVVVWRDEAEKEEKEKKEDEEKEDVQDRRNS